tara:strand:- start:285 stop:491 length:207 start_codon:yes stop_codon:yes gene_type:complete
MVQDEQPVARFEVLVTCTTEGESEFHIYPGEEEVSSVEVATHMATLTAHLLRNPATYQQDTEVEQDEE